MLLLAQESISPDTAIVWATKIIAGATIAYVVVSAFMWWTMRKSVRVTQAMHEAANRPYVGCEKVEAEVSEDNTALISTICIKNFGHSPAKDIRADYVPSLGEFVMPKTGTPGDKLILFPGVTHYFWGGIQIKPSLDAVPQEEVLHLVVEIRYKSQDNKEYWSRQEYRYISKIHEFAHVKGEAT